MGHSFVGFEDSHLVVERIPSGIFALDLFGCVRNPPSTIQLLIRPSLSSLSMSPVCKQSQRRFSATVLEYVIFAS